MSRKKAIIVGFHVACLTSNKGSKEDGGGGGINFAEQNLEVLNSGT
jgi:hypothetical protein